MKLWKSIRLAAASTWPAWAAGPAFGVTALLTGILLGLAVLSTTAILTATSARSDSLPARSKVAVATAEALPPWTGPWVGVHLGLAATRTEVDGLFGLAGDGVLGGAAVGYNWQWGSVVAGPWVEYTFADLQTSFSGEKVTLKGSWAAGGRVGWLVTPRLLAFGTYGYTEAEASATFADLPRFDGVTYGGGLEARLGDALSLKIEYRGTALNAADVGGGTLNAVRAGLTYLFSW